jgi:hypothetical protein
MDWSRSKNVGILKNFGGAGSQVHLHLNLYHFLPFFYPFFSALDLYVRRLGDQWKEEGSGVERGLDALREIDGVPYLDWPHYLSIIPSHLFSHNSAPLSPSSPDDPSSSFQSISDFVESEHQKAISLLDLNTPSSSQNPSLLHVISPLSNVDKNMVDEHTILSVASPFKPHQLWVFREWLLVTGPIVNPRQFGRAIPSAHLTPTEGFLGHLCLLDPIRSAGEGLSERALENLSKLSLADIIRQNYSYDG